VVVSIPHMRLISDRISSRLSMRLLMVFVRKPICTFCSMSVQISCIFILCSLV
jgi:hypothetical protein